MTPEEESDLHTFENAVDVANKIGPRMIEETGGHIQTTTTSAAFIYATFCIQAGVSMHESINLLMSTYKYLTEEGAIK